MPWNILLLLFTLLGSTYSAPTDFPPDKRAIPDRICFTEPAHHCSTALETARNSTTVLTGNSEYCVDVKKMCTPNVAACYIGNSSEILETCGVQIGHVITTTLATVVTTHATVPTTTTTTTPIPATTTTTPIPTTTTPIPTTTTPLTTTTTPIPTTTVVTTTTPITTTTTTLPPVVTTPPATLPPVVTTQATVPPTPAPVATTLATLPPVVTTAPATLPPVVTTPAPSCAKQLGIVKSLSVLSPECHRKISGHLSGPFGYVEFFFTALTAETSDVNYIICNGTYWSSSYINMGFSHIRDACGTAERDRVLKLFDAMRNCLNCNQLGFPLNIDVNYVPPTPATVATTRPPVVTTLATLPPVVTTRPPIVTTPTTVATTRPPVVTTPVTLPPVVTTPTTVATTRPPVVTTPPPVVTTPVTLPPVVTTPTTVATTRPPIVTTPATIATNLGPSCAKKLGIVRNRDVVCPECHRKLLGKSDSHSIMQALFQTLLSEDSSKHYDYEFCSTTFIAPTIMYESFADIRDVCGTPERDRVLNIFYEMRKCLTCEQLGYPLVINLNYSLG